MALRKKTTAAEPRNFASVEHLEYNTERGDLFISEYGRNVQTMVEMAMKVDDREKRNKLAQNIVNVMALLNPSVRELTDYKQKLWDHLFIISNFKLDVDGPYPMPEKEAIKARPKPLAYPDSDIRYKYYGKVMEDMIRKIATLEDSPEKVQITQNLANFMKMSYLTWNKDTVDDSTIFKHLEELSTGQMKVDDTIRLNHTAEILAMNKEKMQRDNPSRKGRPNIRKNNNNNNRRKK